MMQCPDCGLDVYTKKCRCGWVVKAAQVAPECPEMHAWLVKSRELQADAAHWDGLMQLSKNGQTPAELCANDIYKNLFNLAVEKINAHYLKKPLKLNYAHTGHLQRSG